MITIAGARMPRIVSVGMSTAESKNIGLIYMETLEQRSRVICGLFEAELPVCNVRSVGHILAPQTRSLAGRARISGNRWPNEVLSCLRRHEAAQEADAWARSLC